MKYKIIDEIMSDVMFDAYGKNKKELFENAAEALFSIVCEIKEVNPEKKLRIKVKGEDLKDLLYNWLQELIAEVDIEEMFFSKFVVDKISDKELEAEIYGEPISRKKSGTVVKAVTYYSFNLEKTDKGYKARVSFDI
jgi:SHS2 domain-containing protein